jgi:hypothetical protein
LQNGNLLDGGKVNKWVKINMFRYFDYVFYRTYSYYINKKDDIPILHSLGFLWIFQVIIIAVLFAIIDKLTNGTMTSSDSLKNYVYISLGFTYAAILIFDLIRYLNKNYYQSLPEIYGNSSLNEKIGTWMILIQPVFLLFIVITILVLTKHHPG